MKRMTKRRGDDLCKGGTQSAGLICGSVRLRLQIDVVGTGDVTEFMNHSPLLRRHHQQQQGQGFERLSHSNGHQPLFQSDSPTLAEYSAICSISGERTNSPNFKGI
jgi:hypothetical protein